MNIFLTQFWTVKLLIHKPPPRLSQTLESCHVVRTITCASALSSDIFVFVLTCRVALVLSVGEAREVNVVVVIPVICFVVTIGFTMARLE